MRKFKLGLFAAVMLVSQVISAQTVQEGRKFIYYQRYQSAKETLEKVLAATPGNPEAVYWLGQTLIKQGDVSGAKELFRKNMEGANGSNPLLLVGMGHVEQVEGKATDARLRYETAISLSKAKDVGVLNAIGRASADKNGDANYGIEKLKLATLIKGFKEPDVYINMGDCYRDLGDGGQSVTAYQKALEIDPRYAEANYKIGKVYLTQGVEQKDIIEKNFNDALASDPNFVPVNYDLYTFYFNRDVNKAKDNFNKYKMNADRGPALDYEEASLLFASGDFQGAIVKADQLIATQGANADARSYRLKGYSYDKLGDSVNAVKNMEAFFSKARPDQIIPDNYVLMAYSAAKLPQRQATVDEYINKAILADTVRKNQIDYARKASDFFKKAGNQDKSAEWMTRALGLNPNPGKVDLYNAGFENFKATNYNRADSIFGLYKQKFPDEVYGHYWAFRSRSVIDSTMEAGLAVADCNNFIAIAEKDKVKNKNTLITAYGYMAGYNANIKKDFPTAITFLDKILELDPTNADASKNRDILQKAAAKGGAKSGGKPGGQ
jgi:tetratricopeptide (TPR) repeat protein